MLNLSEDQLNVISVEARKELARRVYAEYVEYVHEGRWKPARHLLYVCGIIERFLRNELTRYLIIEMPPQHGKSQTITETLPSYYLGKNPHGRVIEISYNEELAQNFGRRNKQKLEQFGEELFNINLATDSRSATEFAIEGTRGGMISRGIGGSITGRPGDLIIVDDPIKNRQEADSETYRNRIWEEWQNTIKTRLSAHGLVILIMTRWHEDDLVGRLKVAEPENCTIVTLPCEAEENDPLGRQVGEALFPEIGKNDEWLKEFKASYINDPHSGGQRAWNALFQQRPSAQEGEMFKRHWWRYWHPKGMSVPPVSVRVGGSFIHVESVELPSSFDEQLQSWDCTFKDSDGSDYVVGQIWARKRVDKYLLDQAKDRMDIIRTMDEIMQMTNRYPKARLKLVEDKANGPAVIQMLKRKISGLVAVNPEGSKIARASAVAPEMESGNVFLPHPQIATWVNDYINTFAAFPKVANDDEVDATSQALNRMMYNTSTAEDYQEEEYYEPAFGRTGY